VARTLGHRLSGLRCWWAVSQGSVGPHRVVLLTPTLNQNLRLLQGVKNLPVKQHIPQLAVEALVITILPGAARLDLKRFDPHPA
jgi:hypothetical protein